jgi:hypothetical protein
MADFSLVPSGHGTNYTGMLTRSIIFSAALFVFLAGTMQHQSASLDMTDTLSHSHRHDHCFHCHP